MLRIEKDSEGCVIRMKLSGRIQAKLIPVIESAMSDDDCGRAMLDLSEVTIVDVDVIRFLMRCEDEGIRLVRYPSYVREWMARERAEGVVSVEKG
jgi:hypothetical protein